MMNSSQPLHLTDSLLLQRISQGSKEAFDALYQRHWEKAYNDAYKRLKDPDHAKDILQEIFTHIWLNRFTLHIENLSAYLSAAIRNRSIKILTKQQRTHPFFDLLEERPDLEERPGRNAFGARADAGLLWKEFVESYETLLKTLPPKRQMIFRLHYHEDLPTAVISAKLGLSRKTVQNQLGKAVEKLRVSLLHLLSVLILVLALH